MFQFPRFTLVNLFIQLTIHGVSHVSFLIRKSLDLRLYIHLRMPVYYYRRVPPFGYLRISGYLLLPAAFRSLSRPSSSLSAKASTLRSFLFDLSALIAFRTDGSLALHRIVSTIWWVVFLIRYPLKITPRMSFPISKRLTFLDLFRICSFQGTFLWLMLYQSLEIWMYSNL